MKLTTTILAVVMTAGAAWGQNPDAVDNARSVTKSLQQIKTNETNAALEAAGVPAQEVKPAPGAPAPAVKPAIIPGSKPATAVPAKAAAKPAASSQNNMLEKVNVVRKSDDVQIEISPREAVTPKVSKLSSPARVVVELPATVMATAQSKIPVGNDGVKDVRIGMDGKTPPTTSVVVDLDQALAYDLSQGTGNKLVLTLHPKSVEKSAPAAVPVKSAVPDTKVQTASAKPAVVPQATAPVKAATPIPAAKQQTASAKPVIVAAAASPTAKSNAVVATPAAKPHDAGATNKPAVAPVASVKVEAPKASAKTPATATTKIAANEKLTVVSKTAEAPKAADATKTVTAPKAAEAPKPEPKKWAMNGKRDPFFSPIVQQPTGSGCSTGKKCLEIGQINLRGVVKSESGFIAVVTNSLNKAYFLHENDPVFNGYVLKITGDSVVFQETVQDKLGKPLTREIVKKITTPAV